MTYSEVYTALREMNAGLSSTFGNPGEGGYRAFYRTPDGRRFEIGNGSHMDSGVEWTIKEVT